MGFMFFGQIWYNPEIVSLMFTFPSSVDHHTLLRGEAGGHVELFKQVIIVHSWEPQSKHLSSLLSPHCV